VSHGFFFHLLLLFSFCCFPFNIFFCGSSISVGASFLLLVSFFFLLFAFCFSNRFAQNSFALSFSFYRSV